MSVHLKNLQHLKALILNNNKIKLVDNLEPLSALNTLGTFVCFSCMFKDKVH